MSKYCSECGNQVPDQAKFCPKCGSPVTQGQIQNLNTSYQPQPHQPQYNRSQQNAGQMVTPNIMLGPDGKYRWIYEMSLFKNPTIFLLIWKIFFFIFIGILGFIMLLDIFEGNMDLERLLFDLKLMGIVIAVLTVIIGISMLIYAAIMGGKYIVMFEMDENGINHKQLPAQARKAVGIAAAAFLVGMAGGNRSAMLGGMAAANTEMYTSFAKTRKVRFYPRRDTIKIRQLLYRNQIYAKPEDYSFVQNYILTRVPDNAKPSNM